jgi:hypothetical protein
MEKVDDILLSLIVIGLTRSHVPTRFDVLDPCLRLSRNTYTRSSTTSINTLYLIYKVSFSLSKCLYINHV